LVEILVPELWDSTSGNIMSQEGDQQRIWEARTHTHTFGCRTDIRSLARPAPVLTRACACLPRAARLQLCRFFVEQLSSSLGAPAGSVRAMFPDAGVAALLTQRWRGQVAFTLGSLNDRSLPVPEEGGLTAVVVCAPDPQGVADAQRVAAAAADAGAAVVLLNPRLASGDAGIGLNARRVRENFLSRLTVTYSLRPVGDGTVYRRYPGLYKVFAGDEASPGRFRLIAETASRPAGEDLAEMLDAAARGGEGPDGEGARPQTLVENIGSSIGSMMRFMNSLK
jgi:hypothetical protein